LDPQLTDDPRLAGIRYKDIVRERYIISKHTNTSYDDSLYITPLERRYLLEFIMDELKRQKEMYDKAKAESQNKH
jgi:hypothetical protein